MKKIRTVATALVACTVVFTSMAEVAQAAQPTRQVEVARGESQRLPATRAPVINVNRLFTGVCTVGPRSSDVIFTCFNIGFTSAAPRAVFCQLRNSPAEPVDFPDQFACQVTRTAPGSVTARIRRIDDGTDSSGWGQNLQLNLLIVN